jgi:hypothetical protein
MCIVMSAFSIWSQDFPNLQATREKKDEKN